MRLRVTSVIMEIASCDGSVQAPGDSCPRCLRMMQRLLRGRMNFLSLSLLDAWSLAWPSRVQYYVCHIGPRWMESMFSRCQGSFTVSMRFFYFHGEYQLVAITRSFSWTWIIVNARQGSGVSQRSCTATCLSRLQKEHILWRMVPSLASMKLSFTNYLLYTWLHCNILFQNDSAYLIRVLLNGWGNLKN